MGAMTAEWIQGIGVFSMDDVVTHKLITQNHTQSF